MDPALPDVRFNQLSCARSNSLNHRPASHGLSVERANQSKSDIPGVSQPPTARLLTDRSLGITTSSNAATCIQQTSRGIDARLLSFAPACFTVSHSKYIKAAFTNRWNLLALAGGTGLSFFFGKPAIGLTAVAALEAAWLGIVSTRPAFRTWVNLRDHQESREGQEDSAEQQMRRMLGSIPRGARQRFDELTSKCYDLQKISQRFRGARAGSEDSTLNGIQGDGLDRLVWLFLKLLYAESSLREFFNSTSMSDIDREIRRVEGRLQRESARPDNEQRRRIMSTLEDNLNACEKRKANLERAQENFDLLKAEQTRLENRIRSIAEMGFGQDDAAMLSSEVSVATESIQNAEAALADIQFVTHLPSAEGEAVPEIIRCTQE